MGTTLRQLRAVVNELDVPTVVCSCSSKVNPTPGVTTFHLERKARHWLAYEGIQYVLVIKVSQDARYMRYRLYDIQGDAGPRQLPSLAAAGDFTYQEHVAAPINITLDNRNQPRISPMV
ncbi:hypothetical protein H257_10598 [Aphanomyces astaci]|uniref:Uncharacterized protein n=1 Tax=Aphanomyces astaci TaxID=112090 RepID=W4G7F4_APHAT|nr:hypothetical protein H257_10598 [Aphanomyces astaci]ETV74994.1 hypothetical protein H257_10598 [Aphanomyces astaci]|eukprot:XP_009835498.1 hypothetical protein H257_10598 [Aphanomyces astaci]